MRRKSALREWIESIIIALVLAIFIRTFFVQAFKIPTGSMRPTLIEGDHIFVAKFIYGAKIPFTNFRLPGIRKPKRGEIVVFAYPEDTKRAFIKRLFAFGGERVEIIAGSVYVDGKVVNLPGLRQHYYYNRGEFGREGEVIVVPEKSFYVLGDNSASSRDSRYWGFVPDENLIGKAILIYWPLHRIRIIH